MRKVHLYQPNFLLILNLSVPITLALVMGAPVNYRLLLLSRLQYQRHRRIRSSGTVPLSSIDFARFISSSAQFSPEGKDKILLPRFEENFST